jgi:hypothetical protein
MDSRLIFLHSVQRLKRRGRCPRPQPTMRIEGARKGEAALLPKCGNGSTEKIRPWTLCGSVPKLTQVGEESILTALERTVLKELGNLTP